MRVFIFLMLFVISNNSVANYRHFLFIPEVKTSINAPTININDNSSIVNATLTGGSTGRHSAKIVWADCEGVTNSLNSAQDKLMWLIVPEKITHNGINVGLSIVS